MFLSKKKKGQELRGKEKVLIKDGECFVFRVNTLPGFGYILKAN